MKAINVPLFSVYPVFCVVDIGNSEVVSCCRVKYGKWMAFGNGVVQETLLRWPLYRTQTIGP